MLVVVVVVLVESNQTLLCSGETGDFSSSLLYFGKYPAVGSAHYCWGKNLEFPFLSCFNDLLCCSFC